VLDRHNHPDPAQLKERVQRLVPHHWELELWEEEHLLCLIRDYFGRAIDSCSGGTLQDVRTAIDQAKGCYACGDDYANSPLDASLLWHFGYWQLRGLFESVDMTSDQASQSSKDV
jgi:hypothetical protein